MLSCAHSLLPLRLRRIEQGHAQRSSEGLYHQNSSHLWKGQVDDSGYPSMGFTNSALPTRSREALCILFATNELKFLLDA